MYQELPAPIQGRLESPTLSEGESFNSTVQDGLPKVKLVYHLIPGRDRRLDPRCTVQQVATEFALSEQAARETLNGLADDGIVHKDDCEKHSYLISPDYWDDIGGPPEPEQLMQDGGIPMASEQPSPVATTTIRTDPAPEADSVQYHLVNTSSDRRNTRPLVESPDGELIPPVAALVALLALGLTDASFAPASGLVLTLSWLAYQVAKLPNHTPKETVQKLVTSSAL